MKALLKLELRRALTNKLFLLSLGIGLVISICATIEGVLFFNSFSANAQQNLSMGIYSNSFAQGLYTLWMPLSLIKSIPGMYFFVAPLFIGLAYSWSYRTDVSSGYANAIAVRSTRAAQSTAKALATFVAGGLVITIPLVVNFIALACFVPAYIPDVTCILSTALSLTAFMSELLFTQPLLYVLARTVIDFILAGSWATFILAVSMFIQNKVAIVALPYVGLVCATYIIDQVTRMFVLIKTGFTILDQLSTTRSAMEGYDGWMVLGNIAFMLAVSIAIPLLKKRSDVL